MKRVAVLVVVLVTVLALLAGCGPAVVATVNGTQITRGQLDEQVDAAKKMLEQRGVDFSSKEGEQMLGMLRQQALEDLINQELLLQEAARQGLKPTPQKVAEEIKSLRSQYGLDDEGKFKQFLAANGLSEPRLNDMMEKNLAIRALQEKVLAGVKPATGEQARQYYDQHKDQYTEPVRWQVRHILITLPPGEDVQKSQVEAKAEALSILNRLKEGADFAALAREKSKDTGTKDKGGLFTFAPGEVVPEFEQAVKNLKPGEITPEPVKTTYGYHIIKLEKIIPENVQPFEQVEKEIINKLTEQAQQKKMQEYLDGLRQQAKIDNKLVTPTK
ncbi:MAG TPA: hypothetical protein GXX25_04485 [Desulfotomaculum sp.]|nr:hypothetical protein [Desulfotomaculum sp.]